MIPYEPSYKRFRLTCSPTALLVTGAVVQGTAGFLGARAEAESLESKSKVAENDARFKEIQAGQVKEAGATEREQLKLQTSRDIASNAASIAGSGVDVGGATAQEVIASTERVGVADIVQSSINTKRRVWTLETSAQASRDTAKQLKRAARQTKRFAPLRFLAPVAVGAGQSQLATKQGVK
jgi:hypothetical protein